MKIVVLGYMCSGKSLVSSSLAKKMNLNYIDLDAFIEEKENQKITTIFKDKGEIYFRKIEKDALKEILKTKNNFILAVGGGTPCYYNNMDMINKFATSYYLNVSTPVLMSRIVKEKQTRPLVSSIHEDDLPEFIAKHLFERSNYYLKAKHVLSVSTKSIKEIVLEIKNSMLGMP